MYRRIAFCLFASGLLTLWTAPSEGQAADAGREWTLSLDGFFPYQGRMSPLLIYARDVDGKWLVSVGSSRDPYKQGRVKKT